MAVHLAVAGDVFDNVLFCAVLFPYEMSWLRSKTEWNQFLRTFIPTLGGAKYCRPRLDPPQEQGMKSEMYMTLTVTQPILHTIIETAV